MKLKQILTDFFFPFQDYSPDIQSAIQGRVNTGEKIAASIQAVMILFLGGLWFFAPKGHASNHSFSTIPTVLIPYLPFLFARLYFAFRSQITAAVATLFTFIDILMILLIIWLYHLEYQQPPVLSLRASTFQFLFLMIALRCLSFRPAIVLFATILASLGWAGLLVFAATHPDTIITRYFVDSAFSEKILIGSEVEKILGLLATGLTLTVAIFEATKILGESIKSKMQTDVMSRFFSQQVADFLKNKNVELIPGKGTKRIATVLFIDLRGFTAMASKMDPDLLMGLLGEYHQRVVPKIFANNGAVDKFLGDGIMAHFGAVSDSQSHARDCLNSIDEVIQEIQNWNIDLAQRNLPHIEVNLAAATGAVIFGATGDKSRLEMTIIGNTVNVAAKLEKLNKKLNASVTVNTRLVDLAFEQGYQASQRYTLLEKQSVDGQEVGMDLYILPKKSA
jgi:adenylate cyclase